MYGIDPIKEQKFIGALKTKINNEGGKILYLCVSGSHLYGFNSEDSDIDYRGCFQLKTNKLLTTRVPDTYSTLYQLKDGTLQNTMREGQENLVEIDAVMQELSKEIGILLRGNCNFNEHLFSPPIITSPEHTRLRQLIDENLNIRGLYDSYRGMATHNRKKFLLNELASPKKFLYVFRGLLAAMYVIQNHKIESNIEKLNEYFDSPIVAELIDLKRRGQEKGMVKNAAKYLDEVDRMFKLADEEALKIPPKDHKLEDEHRTKLDEWLHNTRIYYLDYKYQS